MKRADLINAAERVVKDLSENNVETLIDMAIQSRATDRSDKASWFDLATVHAYLGSVASYGIPENTILKTMSISDITKISFWQKLLAGDVESDEPYTVSRNINIASTYLIKFASLLRREADNL